MSSNFCQCGHHVSLHAWRIAGSHRNVIHECSFRGCSCAEFTPRNETVKEAYDSLVLADQLQRDGVPESAAKLLADLAIRVRRLEDKKA